jgi:hypothetical protein
MTEQEQFAAMDDMADWGVKHLKESPCPAVSEVESANKVETAQSEVTQ